MGNPLGIARWPTLRRKFARTSHLATRRSPLMLQHRLSYGAAMIAAAIAIITVDGRFAPIFPLLFIAATFLTWRIGTELVWLVDRLPLRIRHRRYARWGALAIVWANWLPALVGDWTPLDLTSPTM